MTWLLLDCDYLCHRAYHALGGLAHRGSSTSVIYGFFRDVIDLQDTFNNSRLIFCFDSRVSNRAISYPLYKSNRKHDPDLIEQIKALRREYLPQVGFRNIFMQKGYEADDIIAGLCEQYKMVDIIIVSSDKDLYQVLSKRVSIWHPQKKQMVTEESFSRQYGVTPIWWVDVKAIAGCSTDCIAGVPGVGEKTAAKFLSGTLKPTSKANEAIHLNNATWRRNISLVKLPFPGLEPMQLEEDEVSLASWRELCDRFGMRSIRDQLVI